MTITNLPAILPDLSTSSGQAAHYRSVHARLFGNVGNAAPVLKSAPLRKDFEFPGTIRERAIIEDVLAKHQVAFREMTSSTHEARVVHCRWEAYYRFRMETDLSYPQIGRLLNKGHASVMRGVVKYVEMTGADTFKPVGQVVDAIVSSLIAQKVAANG